MDLVLSRNVERIEKEGIKLGIKTEVIRKLLLNTGESLTMIQKRLLN